MPVFKEGSKLTRDEQASEGILRCNDILKITLKMTQWASCYPRNGFKSLHTLAL